MPSDSGILKTLIALALSVNINVAMPPLCYYVKDEFDGTTSTTTTTD